MAVSRLALLKLAGAAAMTACGACDLIGPTSAPPMVIAGRAGYVAGVLAPGSPQGFTSVFVGAWRGGWGSPGQFCVEVLGPQDGSFTLEVPASCFREGEAVYLTAGGLATCVTRPFRSGERVDLEILGRREPCR